MKKFLFLLLLALLLLPGQSWAAQTYYTAFTVASSQITGTLTNFTGIIKPAADSRFCLTGSGGHVADAQGDDIRPYSDSGLTTAITQFYLVPGTYVGSGSCTFEMHVMIASAATGSVVYVGMGDTGMTSPANSSTAWDSDHTGVYLVPDGSTLSLTDFSQSANNGTNAGGAEAATATTGLIDGGVNFDGANNQHVNLPNADKLANLSAFTLQLAFKTSDTTHAGALYAEGSSSSGTPIMSLTINNATSQRLEMFSRGDSSTISDITGTVNRSDNAWHCATLVRTSASAFELFVDNTSEGTSSTDPGTTTVDQPRLGVLERTTIIFPYYGSLDNVLRSKIARSNAWTAATCNNMLAPTTFFSMGADTPAGGGGGGLPPNGLLLLGVGGK